MKEEILQKIESLYDLDKHQEIIDMIEALPAEQLNTELISELGRAYNNTQQYEKGLELLKSIEFEEANNPRWNCRIAYSYYFLDDFKNAEKYLLKANELNPEDDFTYTLLIETYISLSRVEDENRNQERAIEYALEAKKYIRDEEGEANADSFLAWLYDRYGHYIEAEELLKNMINKSKNDEWLYSELGYCLAEQGRQEEALENYQKVIELGRKDTWVYSEIAWTYFLIKKPQLALDYIKKAKEISPVEIDLVLTTRMASILLALAKHKEAIKMIEEIISKEEYKNDINLLSNLAYIYIDMNDYNSALTYLQRLKELGRNDEWLNKNLILVYSKLENIN